MWFDESLPASGRLPVILDPGEFPVVTRALRRGDRFYFERPSQLPKAAKRERKLKKKGFVRKKVSRLTTDKTLVVDYKDYKLLRSFLSETGKILPRRITGNTAKQQREVCLAIKRARHLALIAYPGQVD